VQWFFSRGNMLQNRDETGDSSSTRWRRVDWYVYMFLRKLLHCKL